MIQKTKGNPAIVLGLTANGLGVTRSLGKRGIECFGIYCSKKEEVGYASKYLKSAIKISEDWSDESLLATLHSLYEKAGVNPCVLFPTSDTYVRFIARNKSRLEGSFLFHYTEEDLLSSLNDKSRTDDLIQLGLHLPFTIYPHNEQDLEVFAAKHCFPAIIKPTLSDVPGFPAKVVLVSDAQELQNFFRTYSFLFEKCIIQEFIPGGMRLPGRLSPFVLKIIHLRSCVFYTKFDSIHLLQVLVHFFVRSIILNWKIQ
ncbi:hypothetical protein DGMP_01180 [Desulfomarina profundi]|uniref:ATP-grasp domain-containing protein n=1 Tax=Desulfomarina profundi TaxID=2772557 RepID=A0A8D5FF97_9BACT|nr:hypothetical protein [Desulfomarina profundi]BCL59425.1 hypothetical protein DGMP_01180 [Desulfomarina profundi]